VACQPPQSKGAAQKPAVPERPPSTLFALRLASGTLKRFPMLMIEAEFQPAFAKLGLHSFTSIAKHFLGGDHPGQAKVVVRQATLPMSEREPASVFYKHYQPARPKWEFIGRRSKARCEYDNYGVFSRLKIPAPDRIAVGEERDALGRLLRTFIVTRAIPDAMTLAEFVQKHCPNRRTAASRALRADLWRQVADLTRRIHDAGFFHHDLVWRNVLVTSQPTDGAQVWWIDCPRGAFSRLALLRWRARLRDLASLDKSASRWCSVGERMQFVKRYLGKKRLDGEAKQLIRDELRYRRTRWPEDWNER